MGADYDYDIAIVGAGIAGSTLAAFLAMSNPTLRLALIDRNVRGLPGSTGHAPGIVAQVNSYPALTELARRSVEHYRSVPGGFDAVGGLEVVFGDDSKEWLRDRAATARDRKLPHQLLTANEAATLSPALVRDTAAGALFYPGDGTANAKVVTWAAQDAARTAGATLIDADVKRITPTSSYYTITTATAAQLELDMTARRVVLGTGVWAGQLAPHLSARAVAFAHPYAYARMHATKPAGGMKPFVRFPGQLTYARDHGERYGLGSYAHDPVVMRSKVAQMDEAYAPFHGPFTGTMDTAAAVLPEATTRLFGGRIDAVDGCEVPALARAPGAYSFTGMFTITPDGLPMVGKMDREGMYAAVGCWVTQAAGAMGVLAEEILADVEGRQAKKEDAWLRSALDPMRFKGKGDEECERVAVEKYRDIWNQKGSGGGKNNKAKVAARM